MRNSVINESWNPKMGENKITVGVIRKISPGLNPAFAPIFRIENAVKKVESTATELTTTM
jgi:hypothetical protein